MGGRGIELLAIAPADRWAYFVEGESCYQVQRGLGGNKIREVNMEEVEIARAKHGFESREGQFNNRDSLFEYLDQQMLEAYGYIPR